MWGGEEGGDMERESKNKENFFNNNHYLAIQYTALCCQVRLLTIANSLHEDPTFSIHFLTHTGSSCLLRCHDCVMPCAGMRALKECTLI